MRLSRLKRFGSTTSAVPSQLLLTTSTGRVGFLRACASPAHRNATATAITPAASILMAATLPALQHRYTGSGCTELAQAPVDLRVDVERLLPAGGAARVGRHDQRA